MYDWQLNQSYRIEVATEGNQLSYTLRKTDRWQGTLMYQLYIYISNI
jgi:hypothetical protein